MNEDFKWIYDYLIYKGYDLRSCLEPIEKRKSGYQYTKRDHMEAIVLSLLSAQRPWVQIENNKARLAEIFHNYDPDFLMTADPDDLEVSVCSIGCGNRQIHNNMRNLRHNVAVLNAIERAHGTCDYMLEVASRNPDEVLSVAAQLSEKNSCYKLHGVGIALALQYMKWLGVDAVKPDVHVIRMVHRLGWCKWYPNEYEAFDACKQVAKECNVPMAVVGTALWTFCATGYGEICSVNPKCRLCPVNCASSACGVTPTIKSIRDKITWNKFFAKSPDKFAQANALIAMYGTTDMHVLVQHIREENPDI